MADDKEQIEAMKYLFSMGDSTAAEERDFALKMLRKEAKPLKKAMKSGTPIHCFTETAFGLVGPGALPEGVPRNFSLFQQANLQVQRGPNADASDKKLGNKRGETEYRDYYDDIAANEDEWMSFFDHPDNIRHVNDTCSILGTLATIYRQRGSLDECERVLNLEDKVLEKFEKSCAVNKEYVDYYRTYKFRARHVRYNMCFQQQRYDENVGIYRELCDYELRRNLNFDNQRYLFMITVILKKKPTAKVLKKLTDDEVMKLVLAPLAHGTNTSELLSPHKELRLKKCLNCNVRERAVRQHMKCNRCKKAVYCGRECQVAHWPEHKLCCVPAAAGGKAKKGGRASSAK